MTAVSLIGGASLLIAALAFHARAQLLGRHGQGWPEAPLIVRLALELPLLPLIIAGVWWVVGGTVPQWLLACVAVSLALYGAAMGLNVARQRQQPGQGA